MTCLRARTARIALVSFFLATALLTGSASATNILVSPVGISLPAGDKARQLTLRNEGAETVFLQIRIKGWAEGPEGTIFTDQSDIVASPPFAKIEPGKTQLVRIVNVSGRGEAEIETSYRILIDEIPQTARRDSGENVRFLMRYSLPLFLGGPQYDRNSLDDRARLAEMFSSKLRYEIVGGNQLRVSNDAALHARLAKLSVGGESVVPGLLGYVLPGKTQVFDLPRAVPPGSAVVAEVNGVEMELPR